jgi:hypothetical protein
MTTIHVFANHNVITIANDNLRENRAGAGKQRADRPA